MKQHFIPRDATVADLERKAADAEEKAVNEPEPRATELREEAKLYREWEVEAMDIVSGLVSWRNHLLQQPSLLSAKFAIILKVMLTRSCKRQFDVVVGDPLGIPKIGKFLYVRVASVDGKKVGLFPIHGHRVSLGSVHDGRVV